MFNLNFIFQVDILINVLKNLKGNEKLDGLQYLLVSINTIKLKWSPMLTQRAITGAVEKTAGTSNNDRTLSNYTRTKRDNSKLIFNAKHLNTLWIAQFFRRTLSEFVFESVNLSVPLSHQQRALKNEAERNGKIERSLPSTGVWKGGSEIKTESLTESHQKKVKTKKKQPSTYKCVLCEKRSVYCSVDWIPFFPINIQKKTCKPFRLSH